MLLVENETKIDPEAKKIRMKLGNVRSFKKSEEKLFTFRFCKAFISLCFYGRIVKQWKACDARNLNEKQTTRT